MEQFGTIWNNPPKSIHDQGILPVDLTYTKYKGRNLTALGWAFADELIYGQPPFLVAARAKKKFAIGLDETRKEVLPVVDG